MQPQLIHSHDAVHWYMQELSCRVVAESGIPSDRHHLGKLILQGLKDAPDFVLQIDGGTGQSETNASVLHRTIKCASSFRKMGLKQGDVMILMAPTHLDLAIPYYTALCLGIIIAPIDRTLGVYELQTTFELDKPKIIFCQSEKQKEVQQALDSLEMIATIVTFDKGVEGACFSDILEQYGNDTDVNDFRAADFDASETIAILISSSGTTGAPKAAAHTHKSLAIVGPYILAPFTTFPTPIASMLTLAPLQWISTILKFILSAVIRFTRIQSSRPLAPYHIYNLINNYKPAMMMISPTMMTTLLKPGERENCDFTCFQMIIIGGSAVQQPLVDLVKSISPKTDVADMFGISEIGGIAFQAAFGRPGSCGTRYGAFKYRLVDTETHEEILEPNVPGELWLKGPGLFKYYYNKPEDTAAAMTKDGWFKTGDMLYRDEHWNYYFVERIKLLLKYRNHQISPVEVESVILRHPGVLDAAVTAISHAEFGDLPVACVVRCPGCDVTANDIKLLVKNTLTDTKQLRGGVVFMEQLPQTTSTKINRRKLREMVLTVERE